MTQRRCRRAASGRRKPQAVVEGGELGAPEQFRERGWTLAAVRARGSTAHELHAARTMSRNKNAPPRWQLIQRGGLQPLRRDYPDTVADRLVGGGLMCQPREAVDVALNLVPLDAAVQEHDVRARAWT